MRYTLKDYQVDAVADVLRHLHRARDNYQRYEALSQFALAATTGAGKTVMAAAVIEAQLERSFAELGRRGDLVVGQDARRLPRPVYLVALAVMAAGLSATRTHSPVAGSHSSTHATWLTTRALCWAIAPLPGSSSAKAARSRARARFITANVTRSPLRIRQDLSFRKPLARIPRRRREVA